MQITQLNREDLRRWRSPFRSVNDRVPATITASGALDLLSRPLFAFFCSLRCPADLIRDAYKAAQSLQDLAVIGGFHSPVEKQCLTILLEREQPVVICPGRTLHGMRLPAAWQPSMDARRLLLLSALDPRVSRVTAETAWARNHFVCTLADEIFMVHASPGGKTEQLCRDILTWNKPLFTLDSPHNASLISLGARRVRPQTLMQQIAIARLADSMSARSPVPLKPEVER